jgi:hypothetical protein
MTAVTQDALLALIASRKAQSSRQKTLKPAAGRGRYRILPGWKFPLGDPRFFMDFGQHFVKDAAGAIKAVYICTDKTFGRPCTVCNTIAEGILNSTDDVTKKRLEDARSSSRVLLNVLHRDGPTPNEVQILEVAPSVLVGKKGVGGIMGIFSEFPTLLDLTNGHDVIIEKAGTGKNDTTYSVQVAGGSQPVSADVLTKLHDLDKFVAVESEEAMRRALSSVHAISGLLPAPAPAAALAAPRDVPATPAPAMMAPVVAPVAAPVVVVAAPVAAPAVKSAVELAKEAYEAAIAAATAAAAVSAPVAATPVPAAVAAPAPTSTGDKELDALLADLK